MGRTCTPSQQAGSQHIDTVRLDKKQGLSQSNAWATSGLSQNTCVLGGALDASGVALRGMFMCVVGWRRRAWFVPSGLVAGFVPVCFDPSCRSVGCVVTVGWLRRRCCLVRGEWEWRFGGCCDGSCGWGGLAKRLRAGCSLSRPPRIP
jgi:hypothetical protein